MPLGQFPAQGQLPPASPAGLPDQPGFASGGAAPHKARWSEASSANRARRSFLDLPASRQESFENKTVGQQAGSGQPGDCGARARNDDDRYGIAPHRAGPVPIPDRKCRACRRRKPGRCCGLAAAGQQKEPFALPVVFVIALQMLAQAKMVEQPQGPPGVLGSNQVHAGQDVGCPRRQVAEVADRCADQVQGSRYRPGELPVFKLFAGLQIAVQSLIAPPWSGDSAGLRSADHRIAPIKGFR